MKESLHPEVQFSLEAGLVNPRDIRERMQGIVTYKAQDQRTGEPVFVKQALVPEAKKHIVREVAAQHLLYERSLRNPDGAGFAFLYPELRNSSLILPDLEQSEGKWLAQERGDKFVSDAYEKYGDAMQRFFVAPEGANSKDPG